VKRVERKLLDAEWTILRALWDKPPQTLRKIVATVQSEQPEVSWQYKTYHSYLRIMLEKGLIGYEDKNLRDKLYFPLITREEALRQESETLLARISAASMGALVLAMSQNAPFSEADRRALMGMAEKLEHAKGGKRDGE
jgi:BlaI family penicillinase repressor